MKEARALVRTRLVEFQRRIAELTGEISSQREHSRLRERELTLGLLEIADAFDNLEEVIRSKEERLDKSARRMANNARAIHRKLLRHLEVCSIVPLAPAEMIDRRATRESCKVVETQECPGQPDETVLAVVKCGYIDVRVNEVIRKADVVTVRNTDHGSGRT